MRLQSNWMDFHAAINRAIVNGSQWRGQFGLRFFDWLLLFLRLGIFERLAFPIANSILR